MAAALGTDIFSSDVDHNVDKEVDDTVSRGCEQATNMSSQLLYPEKYAEHYQAEKLNIIGKGSKASGDSHSRTFHVPQSSVLSRIQNFLPQLSVANKKMAAELADNPHVTDKFNIEHIEEDDKTHVEMNLSFVQPELLGSDSLSSDDESISDSCSESESDDDEHIQSWTEPERTVRLHPRRVKHAKPNIEVIEESESGKRVEKITTDR